MKLTHDSREIISHNFSDFPVHAKYEHLSNYANYTISCHFHEDLEFIYVIKGEMFYKVNGVDYLIKENEGLFINSNILHYGYQNNKNCVFKCFCFSLSLFHISSYLDSKYLRSITNDAHLHAIKLTKKVVWQNNIIHDLLHIYDYMNHHQHYELKTISKLMNIYSEIYEHKNDYSKKIIPTNKKQVILLSIIHYIQEHYMDNITLENLCDTGNISKSGCIALFKKTFNQTPISFINQYRIEKSCEMLRNSNLSITEIAFDIGFHNPSYFSETFKRYMKVSPRDYMEQDVQ